MTEDEWNHMVCVDCGKNFKCIYDKSKSEDNESCEADCKGDTRPCYCKECTKKRFGNEEFSGCIYATEKVKVQFT